MDTIDEMLKLKDNVKCDIDQDGNRTYTSSWLLDIVKWPISFKTAGNEYHHGAMEGYCFLRALCDKKGKLLAYTRAIPIAPDPFPSMFHKGQWYAFESYNAKLLKDFEITAYNFDGIDANWKYNAQDNSYELKIPTYVGPIEHFFIVRDNEITTDYGQVETRTYDFNTKRNVPNPTVVKYINNQLVKDGVLKPKTKCQIRFEKMKNKIYKLLFRANRISK